MKKTLLALLLTVLVGLAGQVSAQTTYMVSPFRVDDVNPLDPNTSFNSLAFGSGGLVDAGGSQAVVPVDNAGAPVYFTVGYPFAATAAFVAGADCGGTPCADGAAQLVALGDGHVADGAKYRYDPLYQQTGIGAGAWDICFSGVRDLTTGELCLDVQGKEQNYFEDELLLAQQHYRAALAINPYNTNAAEGLLKVYYERMAPLIYGGNVALILSTRARMHNKTTGEELTLRREAEALFQRALDIFIEATGLAYDMRLLNGTDPYVDVARLRAESDPADLGVVPFLVDTYATALARRSETIAGILELEYLSSFSHPVYPIEQAPERQAILAELQDFRTSLTRQSLVLTPFSDLDTYLRSDISLVSTVVGNLNDLDKVVRNGDLFFSISRDLTGNVTGEGFGSYSPEYVPFLFDPYQYPQYTNSFALLLDRAKENGEFAQDLEDDAFYSIRDFDNNQAELEQRFQDIRSKYNDELVILCGQRLEDGELVPDLKYFLHLPEDRLQFDTYTDPGESKGAVYQQHLAVETAGTNLDAALLDLENIYLKIEAHEDTAEKIAGTLDNLAMLMDANGKAIAAIDSTSAHLQALIQKEQAKRAKKNGINKLFKAVGTAVVAFYTQNYELALKAAVNVVEGVNDIRAASSYGKSASHTEQLGILAAQKEKIKAMESAQIVFQQRTELLLKTEEDVFAMMLDAERLKLNIMMAEQRLDMEMQERDNLLGRVAYLIQESHRATTQLASSPLAHPHFRLIDDEDMRRTDAMFNLTKEKTYLAAMAGVYKINSPESLSTTIEAVLGARKVSELTEMQINLDDTVANFYRGNGTSVTAQRSVSMRHFLVQNNHVVENANGFVDWEHPDTLLQEFRDSNGNVITSDAHWLSFLQSCKVWNPQLYAYSLVIPFTTSLNYNHPSRPISGGEPLGDRQRFNPLFDYNAIDMKIVWTNGDANRKGVQIDFRGPNLVVNNTDDVKANLLQEGASYMRAKSWALDPQDSWLRTWNLEPTLGRVTGTVNGDVRSGTPDPSNPQFHERSPANDRWVLTLEPTHAANRSLINNLDKITDIVLTFSVEFFTPAN